MANNQIIKGKSLQKEKGVNLRNLQHRKISSSIITGGKFQVVDLTSTTLLK